MESFDWKRLSQREKIMTIGTFLVVMSLGFYMLEYQVQQKKSDALGLQLDQVSESIKSFETALSLAQGGDIQEKILKVSAEILDLHEEMKLIKDRMTENILDIVRELRRQAEFQGAELVSFNSREREVDEEGFSYREITVFLTMKSNFRSVENFVRALERIPAVLSMRDFEIVRTRANYPRVETTFTLKFYVM